MSPSASGNPSFLRGGGEMGEIIRNFDWSQTSIGTPDNWPQSLRICLGNLLHSGFPMFLFWGDDLICFYNDAFRPSLGTNGKHPAVGKKGKEVWAEIWDFVGQLIDRVMTKGNAVWFENQPVTWYRNGRMEEMYWTFSYGPVLNEEGNPAGVMVTCNETTESVTMLTRLKDSETRFQSLVHDTEESEAKFRLLIEEAPVATCLFTGEAMTIEVANDLMLGYWGKSQSVLGKTFEEAVPELKHGRLSSILRRAYQTGQTFEDKNAETKLSCNGIENTCYFDYTFKPIADTQGRVLGIINIWVDVTDRVLAQRRIEESEARFRTMAEHTPVMIAVADHAGTPVYFNNGWRELTGKTMDDLVENGWTKLVHEDDREPFIKQYMEALGIKSSFSSEFRIKDVHDEYRWLLAHITPRFNTDGSFAGYISACTDITDNKQIEQQLQTTLEQVRLSKEAAELGTFDLDLEKGSMHWDERCRVLFGISHQEPVVYERDFVQGLHPDDRDRILKIIAQVMIKSISNGDYDVQYRTVGAEDRVVRWVKAKGKVYFNEDEKPVRFIGSVLDITEQVNAIQAIERTVEERTRELAEANNTLQRMNQELKRSNVSLEEFAHAASHDLKEPIRKIAVFAERLKNRLTSVLHEEDLKLFNRIENAAHRMTSLITDLLLYSDVSDKSLRPETVDLNQKVQQVIEDLELDIENKKATIQVLPLPIVTGFGRQLQQMFQNFLSNAIKYSKDNVPPVVTIGAKRQMIGSKDYHVITIADNGIGFEQQYAEKIFQMFLRLHGRNEYSGTGIGLSIVKKVVENHNGFIEVTSEPGKGSTFTVFLPM